MEPDDSSGQPDDYCAYREECAETLRYDSPRETASPKPCNPRDKSEKYDKRKYSHY